MPVEVEAAAADDGLLPKDSPQTQSGIFVPPTHGADPI